MLMCQIDACNCTLTVSSILYLANFQYAGSLTSDGLNEESNVTTCIHSRTRGRTRAWVQPDAGRAEPRRHGFCQGRNGPADRAGGCRVTALAFSHHRCQSVTITCGSWTSIRLVIERVLFCFPINK
jgi:hypothetical protein